MSEEELVGTTIDCDEALVDALEHVASYVDIYSVQQVCKLAAKRIRAITGTCTHRWYLIVTAGLYRHQCHDCGHNIGNNEMMHMVKNGKVDHDQMEIVQHCIKEQSKSSS